MKSDKICQEAKIKKIMYSCFRSTLDTGGL